MTAVLCTGLGFLAGAMPFSVWLGRIWANIDIRRFGDGNPGAANAWRAGGWRLGLPGGLLDYLKGALPVGLAHFKFGISGWWLVPVALAPVLGHAFSPFLRFRGGKAMAATFGIWTGLTLGEGPIVLGMLVGLWFLVQSADAWSIILSMVIFLVHLLLRGSDAVTLAIWAGNMLVIVWKHRHGLHEPIRLRKWVSNLMRGIR